MMRSRRQKNAARQSPSQSTLKFEINGPSATPFPLTPALSPGEREKTDRLFDLAEGFCLSGDWWTILPLPKGEGRGEGEARVRVPSIQV